MFVSVCVSVCCYYNCHYYVFILRVSEAITSSFASVSVELMLGASEIIHFAGIEWSTRPEQRRKLFLLFLMQVETQLDFVGTQQCEVKLGILLLAWFKFSLLKSKCLLCRSLV